VFKKKKLTLLRKKKTHIHTFMWHTKRKGERQMAKDRKRAQWWCTCTAWRAKLPSACLVL